MSFRNILTERIILPFSDWLSDGKTYSYLQEFLGNSHLDESQVIQLQNERIKILIKALMDVPFYQDWFSSHNINQIDIKDLDTIQQLPIVDKRLMQREGITRFSSKTFPKNEIITASSSGSTGEPFQYFTSKLSESVNTAAKIRTWYNVGYRLGDRYVKIAYLPRPKYKQWQDRLNNCIYLRFISPDEHDMDYLLKKVADARPTIIRAHANVAFYLAQAQQRLHLPLNPRFVMTTATNLTPNYRKTIMEAFSCDVIDSYSCEGTPCVAETPLHDGYHVCREYGIIETLDQNNNPVNEGYARVVATDLWNLAHPFIRYDTHDLVELHNGVITRIIGRDNEMFTAKNGRTFTGYAVGDYFAIHQHDINSYQLICEPDKSIKFRIVPGNSFQNDQIQEIISYWQKETGQSVSIEIADTPIVSSNSKQRTIIQMTTN